jgi:hypothetical protein
MARKTMLRADMIKLLKSRGQKGALSKMTKAQLKKLLEDTAPLDDTPERSDRHSSELELEPDEHQRGGHYFDKEGKPRGSAKHKHDKNPWPVAQDGSGYGESKGAGHSYRDFMKKNLKQYGGSMQKAAAAYREQKGGHFVKRDGSTGRGEDGDKYHHKHDPEKNPEQDGGHYATVKGNPAKGESTKYKHSHSGSNAASKAPAPASKAPAPASKAPAPASKAPAPAPAPAPKPKPKAKKPKDLSKIPDSMLTDAERKRKKAAADAEAAETKAAERASRKKAVAAEARRSAEERRVREANDASARKRKEAAQKAKDDAKARKRATASKAKASLKSGKPMNAYQRFAAEQRSRGFTNLKEIGRMWTEQKERLQREERDRQDLKDDAEFAAEERARLPTFKKKQRGKGMEEDQYGEGFLDDIEGGYKDAKTWVGRAAGKVKKGYDETEAYVDKHPMLKDLQDGALVIGGVALASTGVGAIGELAAGLGAAGETAATLTEAGELTEGAEGMEGVEGAEEPGAGDPDEVDDLLDGHNPASVGDAAAGADADAGAEGVQSNEVTEANEDAAGNKPDEPKTFGQRLRAKLPGAKEVITGLAVSDAQDELKDAESGPPPPTPPPPPTNHEPPPLPPGYFEHLHDAESYQANSQALGERMPEPFLNPWYS